MASLTTGGAMARVHDVLIIGSGFDCRIAELRLAETRVVLEARS